MSPKAARPPMAVMSRLGFYLDKDMTAIESTGLHNAEATIETENIANAFRSNSLFTPNELM